MIVLRRPTLQDERAFLEAANEYAPEDLIDFAYDWKPGTSYEEMLERLEKNERGIEIPSHFVPSTTYYAFDGDRCVGRLSIRHLLNEALTRRGGHIGYNVTPSARRQGVATEMLKQSLPLARALAIADVLITCADHNIGSWKAIQRNGGTLESTFFDDPAGELVRKYWIRRS